MLKIPVLATTLVEPLVDLALEVVFFPLSLAAVKVVSSRLLGPLKDLLTLLGCLVVGEGSASRSQGGVGVHGVEDGLGLSSLGLECSSLGGVVLGDLVELGGVRGGCDHLGQLGYLMALSVDLLGSVLNLTHACLILVNVLEKWM